MNLLLTAALALLLGTAGCTQQQGAANTNQSTDAPVQRTQPPAARVDGGQALAYAREVVAFGPRWAGNAGHAKLEAYLRSKLHRDNLVDDTFTAATPVGRVRMRNFIAKFPGSKDGVIVISGHYDTLYGRKDFVGANDGGSSTALLLALADQFRQEAAGKRRTGYSVWVVWLDGEEAIREWSATDSLYGSRHLARQWQQDGTAAKIKALINVDMIGDADLTVDHDLTSNATLQKLIYDTATALGYREHFYARSLALEDDHRPFLEAGVPATDIIDFNYGPNNSYWHTPQDTIDKLSAKSFEIVGSVVLGVVARLDRE